MSDLAINASGISHRYGKQQALLDIAFSLPKGTRCGLIGPDGAGKSSLLGLIAGVKKLQQGSLEVLGGPIDDRRHRNTLYPLIAFMPQGLGGNLYPELSISENIRFFGTLFGLHADGLGIGIQRVVCRKTAFGVAGTTIKGKRPCPTVIRILRIR